MIFLILFFLSMPNAFGADSVKIEDGSKAFSQDDSLRLSAYKNRRNEFSHLISLSYSTYNPTNYTVSDKEFLDFYGAASLPFKKTSSLEIPLLSWLYSLKWNSFIGSLSFDLGVGFYFNKSNLDSSKIYVLPIKLGVTWAWDNIFLEPYIVPYLSAGTMSFLYREDLPETSDQRNDLRDQTGQPHEYFQGTSYNIYLSGGIRFQLDWMDNDGDNSSYFERGIENSFIAVGITRIQKISQDLFDLSGDIYIDASLILEF